MKGKHDLVALLDGFNRLTDLHHHAQILVTEDLPLFYIGAALIHVQVGAADIGGGQLDDDVGELFQFGVGNLIDGDFLGAVINKRFHRNLINWDGGEMGVPYLGRCQTAVRAERSLRVRIRLTLTRRARRASERY